MLTRARAIDLLIQDGLITVDEARDFLGLPPLETVERAEQAEVGPRLKGRWYEG